MRENEKEKERERDSNRERARERENGRVLARMCFCLKKNQRNSLRRIYKCLSANIYTHIYIYKSEERKEIFMRFHVIKKKDFTFEFYTNYRKKKNRIFTRYRCNSQKNKYIRVVSVL